MNDRVRSLETTTPQERGTQKTTSPGNLGFERSAIPLPNLPRPVVLKTVGTTGTVLPLTKAAPAGSFTVAQLNRPDELRRQALGNGHARRNDDASPESIAKAQATATQVSNGIMWKDFKRVQAHLEGLTNPEVNEVRRVWRERNGPKSLDIALKEAFPDQMNAVFSLLRGVARRPGAVLV